MYIDVQHLRIKPNTHNKLGVFPFWKKRPVAFMDGMGDGRVFDRTTVDKNLLRDARSSRMMGAHREPRELEWACCLSEWEEAIEEGGPIHLD